jgi:murein DD-endopeptidase MepM/ murein hydrolase activator NlpD
MADPVKDIQALTKAVDKLASGIKALSQSTNTATQAARFTSSAWGMVGGGNSSLGLGAFSKTGAVIGAAAAVGGAAWSGAPNLDTMLARSSGYYSAARMGVNMSRAKLQMATIGALNGGISGVGEDAAAAAMLTNGYYYNPGSTAYMQTMREIGGAAKYLNMPNATAAQALGGLQTGSMGGNLYQYGIQVYNPKTGRGNSTADIAKQLYSRIFAGSKNVSVEDVRSSLQYGFAGANLRNMGFSGDQQQIFSQMFLDIAAGKNPDLANAGNLASQQTAAGNSNPLNPLYQMKTSETGLYQRSESAMIQGFQTAADTVTRMNEAMGAFIQEISGYKGFTQGMGGSNWSGAAGHLGNLGSIALGSFLGTRGGGTAGKVISKAGSLLKGIKAGGVTALAGMGIGIGANQGEFRSKLSGALTYGGTGLMLGGGPESPLGWVLGALGAGYGAFTGGGSEMSSSTFGAHGGPANSMSVQAPVSGANVSATYGQKGKSWKSGSHTGQDYACPIGTPVKAAADGTVVAQDIGHAYGTAIVLDHGNGITTIYGHLSSKSVNAGEKVTRGQVIGKSGDTGNVTGPHLHFEVRKGGHAIDPAAWLRGATKDANPNNDGASSGSVASQVLGNAPGVNLSSSYSLVNSLFQDAVLSSMSSSDPTSSGKASNSAGAADIILGTGEQRSWATKFLNRLGAPTSEANINAMTTWMRYEGGHWKNSAHYNPLNTTQPEDGATSMNRVGVKAYKNWEQGLEATVTTIRNGKYANILSALMQGTDSQTVLSAVNKSPWGTHIAMGGPANALGSAVNTAPGVGSVNAAFSKSAGAGNGRYVQINVYPQSASDQEAMLLAKKVKRILDNDHDIAIMGAH